MFRQFIENHVFSYLTSPKAKGWKDGGPSRTISDWRLVSEGRKVPANHFGARRKRSREGPVFGFATCKCVQVADESGLVSNFLYAAELSGGQEAARNSMTCRPFVSTPSFPGDRASRAKGDEDARNLLRSGRIAKPMDDQPQNSRAVGMGGRAAFHETPQSAPARSDHTDRTPRRTMQLAGTRAGPVTHARRPLISSTER